MKKFMKTFIIPVALFGIFFVGSFYNKANAGPNCPNGCVDGSGGCYCNGWYGCYAEANAQAN